MKCPLCETTLPDDATHCTRCDWVRKEEKPADIRDRMALILSLVPGLGHLYKGHVLLGGAIFFIIGPGILAIALALLPATLGLSLGIPAVFMFGSMMHAYMAPDRRKQVIETARQFEEATGH